VIGELNVADQRGVALDLGHGVLPAAGHVVDVEQQPHGVATARLDQVRRVLRRRRQVAGIIQRVDRLYQQPQPARRRLGTEAAQVCEQRVALAGERGPRKLPANEQVQARRADAPCEVRGRQKGEL